MREVRELARIVTRMRKRVWAHRGVAAQYLESACRVGNVAASQFMARNTFGYVFVYWNSLPSEVLDCCFGSLLWAMVHAVLGDEMSTPYGLVS